MVSLVVSAEFGDFISNKISFSANWGLDRIISTTCVGVFYFIKDFQFRKVRILMKRTFNLIFSIATGFNFLSLLLTRDIAGIFSKTVLVALEKRVWVLDIQLHFPTDHWKPAEVFFVQPWTTIKLFGAWILISSITTYSIEQFLYFGNFRVMFGLFFSFSINQSFG